MFFNETGVEEVAEAELETDPRHCITVCITEQLNEYFISKEKTPDERSAYQISYGLYCQ